MSVVVEFLLQYLALVCASLTSTILIALLGFLTVKRLINKAMQSKEVQDLKKNFEALKQELINLKQTLETESYSAEVHVNEINN